MTSSVCIVYVLYLGGINFSFDFHFIKHFRLKTLLNNLWPDENLFVNKSEIINITSLLVAVDVD